MVNAKTESARGTLGKCLVCGTVGTEEEPTKRGLCKSHYSRFHRYTQKIGDPIKIEAFEAKLVADGKLLPSRQGRKSIEDDPFADAAAEFITPLSADQQKILAEAARANEKFKAKQAKGKK